MPQEAKFLQALAAKSLETVRLTESLSVDPGDPNARVALSAHLRDLRQEAAEYGLVHLEGALGAALTQLEEESYRPAALVGVRVLAWRYEELAAMPGRSGTHSIDHQGEPDPEAARSRPSDVPILTLSGVEAPEVSEVEGSVQGRRILVADDDAEVRWFYVGVLREAGAKVVEARDGAEGISIAREDPPDLILADIVMPRMDGLALCAAVRREPALDGVPVVLLSWRDDFLHRMRELRAGADDYLRKEIPARQILARVSGVLEPLARLEEALLEEGGARGDLEELGVAALRRVVRRLKPNARLVLQDPWSLFEIEFADGLLASVTRTSIDGAIDRGAQTLSSLVGMRSGLFVVAGPLGDTEPPAAPLDGDFDAAVERLSRLIRLLEDADCRVELEPAALSTYVRHSPKGVQSLIARLGAGEPPRALWESGGRSRAVIDALLETLARQGAVRDVVSGEAAREPSPVVDAATDEELVGIEVERESESLRDPLERENVRAQSGVAMHREPANRVSRLSEIVWRRRGGPRAKEPQIRSRFGRESQLVPKVLGWSFVMVFAATVAFLLWREAIGAPEPTSRNVEAPAAAPSPRLPVTNLGTRGAPAGDRVGAHAGRLTLGTHPSLQPGPSQGVLELVGPEIVEVRIDGVDRGELPIRLLLDEGRHVVRYRSGDSWTYRFYHVKAGATRSLRVTSAASGFVDAR